MRTLLAAAATAALALAAPAAHAEPLLVARAGDLAAQGATAACTLTRTDPGGTSYEWRVAVATTHPSTIFRCWLLDPATGTTRGPKPSRTTSPAATQSGTFVVEDGTAYAVCVEVRWDGGAASGCDGA